jgi:hypothetical protein
MKEGMKYAILRKLRWLSLVAIMLIGVQTEVLANSKHYYYKASVSVDSSVGGGKVYVSKNSTNNPTFATSAATNSIDNDDNKTAIVYLYAQAEAGYSFVNWTRDTNSNNSTIASSTSRNTTATLSNINSESQNSPTEYSFIAHFAKITGIVSVKADDINKGHVSIDNPDNGLGDNVVLTAEPLGGRVFVGWTKGNETSYISNENPYSLIVESETNVEYTAHFSDISGKGYIRLQNKSTEKFVSYYGNGSPTGTLESGLSFNGSLQMIDASKAQGNPETVFLKTAHQSSNVSLGFDLMAHDVSYSTLVDAQHLLNMEEVSTGVYRIYANVGSQKSYLCDNGSLSMSIMSTPDASAEWYVYDLSGSSAEGAFGANTKAKYTDGEGKYYTTMFADFAYQCGEGVKAYYLPATEESYDAEEKRVYFTEISSGKVPANTAVVLECNAVQNDFSSTKTVVNILKPILPDAAPAQIVSESGNLLKGYVSVNGSTVTNDMDKMYVLSYDKHLGFHHSTSSTMTPNKAYLNVGTIPEQNNIDVTAVKFALGRSGIDNPDNPDNPDDPTPTDLKGDMNNDGQITITDVMLLLKMVSEE